nr:hypothetical protein [Candidatus Sodalis pierantonius]
MAHSARQHQRVGQGAGDELCYRPVGQHIFTQIAVHHSGKETADLHLCRLVQSYGDAQSLFLRLAGARTQRYRCGIAGHQEHQAKQQRNGHQHNRRRQKQPAKQINEHRCNL